MSSNILLVEDDPGLVLTVSDLLSGEGYTVESAGDGESGLAKASTGNFDLIILDVMLPQKLGFDVCRDLRQRGLDTAILMVTARAQVMDRVVGLRLGADDYLSKPFSPGELVARVRALFRRVRRSEPSPDRLIHYGPIVVDAGRHTVAASGSDVTLTAKEFLLLQYLLEHRGRVLSRDVLLTDVWGYRYTGGTRTVDVHVRRLREKLPLLTESLVTVKQFGYKLLETPIASVDR